MNWAILLATPASLKINSKLKYVSLSKNHASRVGSESFEGALNTEHFGTIFGNIRDTAEPLVIDCLFKTAPL